MTNVWKQEFAEHYSDKTKFYSVLTSVPLTFELVQERVKVMFPVANEVQKQWLELKMIPEMITYFKSITGIHNLDNLTDKRLVVSDDVYISLKPAIPHLFRGDKVSSVYNKISPPYTVFPNVHIGNFPNKQIRDLPSFWHSIKDAVILTDTTVSDEQKSLLDSLNIESHFIPILKDSVMIDVQKVLNILDIIHEIESKEKQVLILCDSEGHLLSKLIGECYHYQKTNKLLDNKILQSTNAIDYYCQKGMLPSLEELKGILRNNKRKKL